MRTITGLDELKQAEGEELGVSDWHEVSQKDIDAFADATGDHQWIHVDPERAKDTPFGGTIAHGYYTLSLAPKLTDEVLKMDGFAFAVNYGLNKVRFPAPVLVDSKVRMRAKLAELEEIPGGAQMIMEQEHERAAGAWHAEWVPLRALLVSTGSAAAWLRSCLEGLEVDAERMRTNLTVTDGLEGAVASAAALVDRALAARAQPS